MMKNKRGHTIYRLLSSLNLYKCSFCLTFCISLYVCRCSTKPVHLFYIFLGKYKEMRAVIL